MGRVSLIVEANTSIAIGNISKLGEAIKNAMAKFDSKALTTWETDAETKINKVGETINKLSETLQTFKNNLKADASFGASKALTEFKRKFEDSFKTLDNFKTYFKEGYTFGATTQVETLKTKIAEAKEAIGELNAEVQKQTTVGANQTAKAKKDEITKLIAAAKELNKQLEKKPVLGARQAIVDFEAGLKTFSQNVAQNIAPALVSLNLVKTQMQELSQVLNSVQQPTWVEPFKTKMQEVVEVLKNIATAYKSVKTEIKQPVGESAARHEFQMTDRQAQSLYRTTKMFYRHVRQELKETRAAATETSRAIREAMEVVQGGGTGAGGRGSSAAGGQRLGFGEQLFSRMRSNLYSYLTMWFGVAGAIRAANEVLELHNELLEQGNQLSNTKFDYLGQLRLKAGANAPEYEAMAERIMKKGMEKNAAYQFAGFAAMSNISAKEAESIAPYFINNIASANDQRALLSAVAYARANGYENYSTEQIMAMFLEANKNNPSELAPTANAFVRNLRTNRLFGMSLEEQMALVSLGGAEQKDANAATIQRALLSRIYSEGLAPMILGEFEGKGYYKDEATGRYKFKDEARQAQYEEDMKNGNQVLTVEMIAQMADKMGDGFTKLIGKRLQANLGASFYADISQDPTKFNEIYASMQAIGGGDLTAARSVLESVSADQSVMTHVAATAAANQAAIAKESRSNFYSTIKAMQQIYATAGAGYGYEDWGGTVRGINDWLSNTLPTEAGALNVQTQRLVKITNDPNVSEDVKKRFIASYDLAIANYVKEHLPAGEYKTRAEQEAAIGKVLDDLDASMGGWRAPGEYNLRWAPRDMGGGMERRAADIIFGKPIQDTPAPTGAVKAVRSAAGATATNKWEEEETARKQAEKEAKQADRDAKRADKEEKQARKNFLSSLPKARLSAPSNAFIEGALGVALSDTDSGLQKLRAASLDSEISGRTGGNILGKAFYAYASDKTDKTTDQEIVAQLVASMNQQGLSPLESGKLAMAFGEDMLKNAGTEENKKIVREFFEDVKSLLVRISGGIEEYAVVKNKPEDRGSKSKGK